jgi:enoyl-CoA hydratase/carnithine racemase
VVSDERLDDECLEVAHAIAKNPPFTVQMFRRTFTRMVNPLVRASMQEESVAQTLVFASEDYAEFKAARAEGREPSYRGR